MGDDGRLTALVEQAYAAALDDTLWEPWAHACLREFGGCGGIFAVVSDRGLAPDRTVNLWSDPRMPEEYFAGVGAFDPQLPVATGLARSAVYLDTDHVDEGNRATRDFMTWIGSHGGRHHMSAVALLGDGTVRACLSVHHSADAGPTPAVEQQKLASIFPAIGHALGLGFRQGELLQQAFWDGLSAIEGTRAALLLDERARVIRASAAALALIGGGEGLTLAQRTLGCARADDAARLGTAIAAAIRPVAPVADAVRVTRKSGRAPFLITAYPLARSHRMLAPLEAAALVTIVDPIASPPARPLLWRRSLGFTAREAEFAALLLAGHSVESASATLGIAVPTARTNLRNMFRKTGTDRQGALLQLLARVGG